MRVRLFGVLVAVMLSMGIGHAKQAQPPVGPASISINQSNVKLGDYVTFTVTAPKNHFDERITVICEQPVPFTYTYPDGSVQTQTDPLVFAMGGTWDYAFLLGGSMSVWYLHDGPAACRAELYYWGSSQGQQTYNVLATTTFQAAGR